MYSMKLNSRALHESNFYTYPNTNEDPKFVRLRTTAYIPHLCMRLHPCTCPHPRTPYLCTCLHPHTRLHQLTPYLCTLLHLHPHPTLVHAPVPTNPTPVHMPAPTVQPTSICTVVPGHIGNFIWQRGFVEEMPKGFPELGLLIQQRLKVR